jgi:endonuclease/exonuclease/phosphatase family metal-dependent hydrolase
VLGRLRVVTYNIHKCQGFDRRVVPERIVTVLRELAADVLCLQEVVNAPEGGPLWDQAGAIGRALPEYAARFGANRPLRGGTYGNLTLSRLPVMGWKNIDITGKREARGVLQTDLGLGSDSSSRVSLGEATRLHIFNVHLGTGFMERRFQAGRLMSEDVLLQSGLQGPRLVIGDFNEWTQGLTTRLLRESFATFKPKHALGYGKTFPGMLPFMTLDHCYYESPLEMVETRLWRSRTALVASDHLPLVADFRVADSSDGSDALR